jgi:hypothetical protein
MAELDVQGRRDSALPQRRRPGVAGEADTGGAMEERAGEVGGSGGAHTGEATRGNWEEEGGEERELGLEVDPTVIVGCTNLK